VSIPDPPDFAREQEARLVSLEAAQVAASIVCVVAILVAIASGATSLVLGRSIERHRDREIAYALLDMRDWLMRTRAQPLALALPPPQPQPALAPVAAPAALPAPTPRSATAQEPAPAASTGQVIEAQAAPTGLPATASASLPPLPIAPRAAPGAVRVITPDQRDRMVRILGLAPDSVVLTSDGSNEAEAFADQLAGVFRDAGWKVERSLFVSLKRPLPPLSADLLRQPRDQAVIAAFAAAGYDLPRRDPNAPVQIREIFVGRSGGRG
jgi:hypothetical protein